MQQESIKFIVSIAQGKKIHAYFESEEGQKSAIKMERIFFRYNTEEDSFCVVEMMQRDDREIDPLDFFTLGVAVGDGMAKEAEAESKKKLF